MCVLWKAAWRVGHVRPPNGKLMRWDGRFGVACTNEEQISIAGRVKGIGKKDKNKNKKYCTVCHLVMEQAKVEKTEEKR